MSSGFEFGYTLISCKLVLVMVFCRSRRYPSNLASFSLLLLASEVTPSDTYHALWKGLGLVVKNAYFDSFYPIMGIGMSSHE
jgi:hypothetical protein